jgi:hypothetical protein
MDLHFCEFCGGAIYPDDLAPVKLPPETTGHVHRVFLHNRHDQDCLALKLEELEQYFASKDAAAQQ